MSVPVELVNVECHRMPGVCSKPTMLVRRVEAILNGTRRETLRNG